MIGIEKIVPFSMIVDTFLSFFFIVVASICTEILLRKRQKNRFQASLFLKPAFFSKNIPQVLKTFGIFLFFLIQKNKVNSAIYRHQKVLPLFIILIWLVG